MSALLVGDMRLVHSCLAKDTYYSQDEAEAAIGNCRTKGRQPLRWYVCPHCGRFHLTSHVGRGLGMAA